MFYVDMPITENVEFSRDQLRERMDYLAAQSDESAQLELAELNVLARNAEGCERFVWERHFMTYCAEQSGNLRDMNTLPNSPDFEIDWEAVAAEMRPKFETFKINGDTYLAR